MIKNAVLLAGGLGTRLQPFTKVVSKQLLNVNGKCVIDYPINTLVKMGIENLTIIVGATFSGQILDYIQDGSQYGLNVNFIYQQTPQGIAQAINLCQRFLGDKKFVVILGDNLYTNDFKFKKSDKAAQIVLYKHRELNRFGVLSLDNGKILKIEEKPKVLDMTVQNYAITGCYQFDSAFFEYFKEIKPSARGEFEITDIIKLYHKNDNLDYFITNGAWFDLGTHETINFVNGYFYKG